jgi:hypothetical protein
MPAPAGMFPQLCNELRKLAAAKLAGENPGHTADAVALVHEAYLRVARGPLFGSRSQFLDVKTRWAEFEAIARESP